MKRLEKQTVIPKVPSIPVVEERIPAFERAINQLYSIDWQVEVYPNTQTWRLQFLKLYKRGWRHDDRHILDVLRILSSMQVSENQYIDISIKKIWEKVTENDLIICLSASTFFIYDGQWYEFTRNVFEGFMEDAAVKMGAPSGLGAKILKIYLHKRLPEFDDDSSIIKAIREEIKERER